MKEKFKLLHTEGKTKQKQNENTKQRSNKQTKLAVQL